MEVFLNQKKINMMVSGADVLSIAQLAENYD